MQIDDSEKIGRFIFSKSHFSKENKNVRYGAFMPAPDNKASVYRIDNHTEEQIAFIDQEFVSGKRTDNRKSKARADIFASQIRETKLDVIPDPTPHKQHANIEGFSSEKSKRKLEAIELAEKATLVKR